MAGPHECAAQEAGNIDRSGRSSNRELDEAQLKQEEDMKELLAKLKYRVERGFHWAWGHKVRVALMATILAMVAPHPAKGIILDPCCAILAAGLSTISSTLSNVVGGGLNGILSIEQTIANFEQTVVWPKNLIAQSQA